MKTQLIYSAILAAAVAALPSCDDKETTQPPANSDKVAASAAEAPKEEPKPAEDEAKAAIAEQLGNVPWLTAANCTGVSAEGGAAKCRMAFNVTENLYKKSAAPEEFDEERKAINASANAAMQPDSAYLLQIGAPTDMITDADRAAKPLPENLQRLADELRELADASVYKIDVPAGTFIELSVSYSYSRESDDAPWTFSNISIEEGELPDPGSVTPESALPENAAVLTPELLEARKEEIRQKIDAFNAAAEPYINGREEVARAAYTEHQARLDEEARKTAEAATAAAAEKEAWVSFCSAAIASGKKFSGEWTRGNRFGEISIAIIKAEKFENSIQFIGELYDTNLPEASLDISGRCELAKNADGVSHVDVTIYDGQYDPDKPTAEVYDARDGMLSLSLDAQGKLNGSMTCASWSETPEKAFRIMLAPAAESSKGSRQRGK